MNQNDKDYFKTEKIWKILCKMAPPVMFAQLIQALYNIVDSLYIGRYSEEGLTALSILFPIQLSYDCISGRNGSWNQYIYGKAERIRKA